ncbi:MAG: 16S rRNA (uracil(1498)-N(3))-methyltransferase [Tetragenococcus halophilus]|nr:16S rRNA (uracil(1498)-N(3))-methyltransferase [Tetragenococcus halophilus]MDN6508553.1 16S rRNA (uracil(1498)-N(3))-methyltransferase [Tetragenococcus halophilus]MDN6526929.1 16S rRNA (uracil(1498)-N(3))-methyltransferase [Tetragenococcus halophilus]
MQRYFTNEKYERKNTYSLSGEPYHHMIHVMRMQEGDQIYLVFSDQVAIQAKITSINEQKVFVEELAKESQIKELPLSVTIACGYPKGDKFDWLVQKATELGAAAFIGFPAKTSIVKWDQKKLSKKQQRLEKITQEAAEQSQRSYLPDVSLLANEGDLFPLFSDYDYVLVAYEESAKQGETATLAKLLQNVSVNAQILAVFGPEGGFTSEEIAMFEQNQVFFCGLGPRILRAETAPLYLLSAISYHWELLNS